MEIFKHYSQYYDILYQDKDYLAEASFVLERLSLEGKIPASLLDLGCGTGKHAFEMAKKGVAVTGVDLSPIMLEIAKKTTAPVNESSLPLVEFFEGDARSFRSEKTFDAAVSLFHVISYQTKEEDLLAVLETVKNHLQPGSFFLFDFWYGPGVLAIRPEKKEKTLENDLVKVQRLASPELFLDQNLVKVHYKIQLQDKTTGEIKLIRETHPMRYWFMPELRYLLKTAGFSLVAEGRWMDTEKASDSDWAAWMMVKI